MEPMMAEFGGVEAIFETGMTADANSPQDASPVTGTTCHHACDGRAFLMAPQPLCRCV